MKLKKKKLFENSCMFLNKIVLLYTSGGRYMYGTKLLGISNTQSNLKKTCWFLRYSINSFIGYLSSLYYLSHVWNNSNVRKICLLWEPFQHINRNSLKWYCFPTLIFYSFKYSWHLRNKITIVYLCLCIFNYNTAYNANTNMQVTPIQLVTISSEVKRVLIRAGEFVWQNCSYR